MVLGFETRIKLIIFDCDGVLIDSEKASTQLIVETAARYGIQMTQDIALERFSGTRFSVVKDAFEVELQERLPDDFLSAMQTRMIEIMKAEAKLMPGVTALLQASRAEGYAIRVGSNSSREEMMVKFRKTGLDQYFSDDRIHSSFDVAQPKPAPDVFLAAAAAEGCDVRQCLVIEDSITGAKAAEDAGMACVLLRQDGLKPTNAPANLTTLRTAEDVIRALQTRER